MANIAAYVGVSNTCSRTLVINPGSFVVVPPFTFSTAVSRLEAPSTASEAGIVTQEFAAAQALSAAFVDIFRNRSYFGSFQNHCLSVGAAY